MGNWTGQVVYATLVIALGISLTSRGTSMTDGAMQNSVLPRGEVVNVVLAISRFERAISYVKDESAALVLTEPAHQSPLLSHLGN